jgi:hypothetical protein
VECAYVKKGINGMNSTAELVHKRITEVLLKSEYSESDRLQFREACLQTPVKDWITVDGFHAKNLNISAGKHLVWFITRLDPQSVFWDEHSDSFGACWGPDLKSGTYEDLGFRSDDPVAVFLI